MQHSFWQQRWEEDRIGFHLPETNPLLAKHFAALALQQNNKIFVPLCGKTLDLLFLKQRGLYVLGNELSPIAVDAFFTENNLRYSTKNLSKHKQTPESSDLTSYQSGTIEIIQGDFFTLEKADLENIDAIYDRASMVALPESMREEYANFLLHIVPKNIKILLITLEYDQNVKQGPPFAVSEQEIYHYYGNDFEISLIDTQETPMKQRGVISKQLKMFEKTYLLQR